MKKAKFVLGILAVGFCLFFMSAGVSVADSPQPPWRATVWPALSSTQWYWYEPETNLTGEQVEAIFKEVAATNIPLLDSRAPGINITVKNAKVETQRSKKRKKAADGSLNSEPVAIVVDAYWTKASLPKSGSDQAYALPLNTIQRIDLNYVSSAKNKWCLGMVDDDVKYLYIFYFKDEDFARKFGNAIASILAQKGILLKFTKLGLSHADLTPAQAEALGKTRIDSVLVTLVAIDGPADKANIQPLDVITEVNGVKVRNDSHFNSLIEGIASGTKVTLTCLQRTEVAGKTPKQFEWKPNAIEVIAR